VRKKVLRDDLDIRIGYNLKQARKESNIKVYQKDIAKLLGVRKGQISRYEDGSNRISASSLFRVAIFYDKDINYFFRVSDEEQNEYWREQHKGFLNKLEVKK
jgi:transcriptional regulator with XRE-family HTH domain